MDITYVCIIIGGTKKKLNLNVSGGRSLLQSKIIDLTKSDLAR